MGAKRSGPVHSDWTRLGWKVLLKPQDDLRPIANNIVQKPVKMGQPSQT